MPWRRFLQQMMNQEQVIRKLEDSAPIRKAAKYTVYLIHKAKQTTEDGFQRIKNSPILKDAEDKTIREKSQFDSFKDKFTAEIEEGFREMKRKKKGGG